VKIEIEEDTDGNEISILIPETQEDCAKIKEMDEKGEIDVGSFDPGGGK